MTRSTDTRYYFYFVKHERFIFSLNSKYNRQVLNSHTVYIHVSRKG